LQLLVGKLRGERGGNLAWLKIATARMPLVLLSLSLLAACWLAFRFACLACWLAVLLLPPGLSCLAAVRSLLRSVGATCVLEQTLGYVFRLGLPSPACSPYSALEPYAAKQSSLCLSGLFPLEPPAFKAPLALVALRAPAAQAGSYVAGPLPSLIRSLPPPLLSPLFCGFRLVARGSVGRVATSFSNSLFP